MNLVQPTKWDIRFLALAEHISNWSKDPSTQVGAIVVDRNRRVISMGYNGLPQGVEDTDERLNDRELKYKLIVHAERNCLLFADRSLGGMTLYTTPLMPCSVCAGMVIQSGVKRVVAPLSNNPRWTEDFKLTQQMFDEAGVQLDLVDPQYLTTIMFLQGMPL